MYVIILLGKLHTVKLSRTTAEARWLIRDGENGGEGGETVSGSTVHFDPED